MGLTTVKGAPVGADGQVHLLAPEPGLRLCLAPPMQEPGPGFTLREVPGSRRMVKFIRGRATMPPEWLPDLERHPSFTGRGGRKMVFIEGEVGAPMNPGGTGVMVVDGARSTATGLTVPPLDGWDQMSVAQILDAIKKGRVEDPIAALGYEGSKRRRVAVIAALAKQTEDLAATAMAGGAGAGDDDAVEPIAEAPAERVPAGEKVD